jgi:hypothetical protein
VAHSEGPFVQTALICERVITEQDGAISAIRIIDRVFFPADAAAQPLNPRHPIWFLISLKSGAARGRFNVTVVRERPSGERDQIVQVPILLEGEDRGANIVGPGSFEPDQEGLYWFDVEFDGRLLTRMPLRAVYQPLPQGIPGPL